jgi:hypothetical protein
MFSQPQIELPNVAAIRKNSFNPSEGLCNVILIGDKDGTKNFLRALYNSRYKEVGSVVDPSVKIIKHNQITYLVHNINHDQCSFPQFWDGQAQYTHDAHLLLFFGNAGNEIIPQCMLDQSVLPFSLSVTENDNKLDVALLPYNADEQKQQVALPNLPIKLDQNKIMGMLLNLVPKLTEKATLEKEAVKSFAPG